jgi:hypothetical protein
LRVGACNTKSKKIARKQTRQNQMGEQNLKVYYTQSLPHEGIPGINWCKTNNINIDFRGNGDISQTTPENNKTSTINEEHKTENDDIFKEIPELQTFFTITNNLPSRKHYDFGID